MGKFYWEEIQKIAKAHHIQDPLETEETFTRFLQFWWSQKFNRPLKDPVLLSYTLEELTYEWLRHVYLMPDQDPKKELEAKAAKEDEDAWIREQLKKVKPSPKPAEPEVKSAEQSPIPELPDISTKFE